MSPTKNVAELRAALQAKNDELDKFVNSQDAVKIEDGNLSVKQADWDSAQAIAADIRQIKGLLEVHTLSGETKSYLTDPDGDSSAMKNAAEFLNGLTHSEQKSIGQMFVESDEYKDMMSAKKLNSQPFEINGIQDIGTYGTKDVFPGVTGGTPMGARPFGTIQFDPMNPRPQRTFRVRDLFPVVATSASLIDYFRVLGFAGGDASGNKAASVPDRTGTEGTNAVFGLKPQSKLSFDSQQAPVRTIAHWEAAHRNVLDDMPQLRGTIDNELLYGLRLEEDRQILNGSGNNDELKGILQTSGIQTYTQSSGGNPVVATEQLSDALRRAATKVAIANFQATGYVLHPNNWEDVELQKAQGDGQYMLVTNIAIGAQTQVWRQPVVETVAITENTFLTGAFGLGAQLYDRQAANVRVSESHADFFVRNAIVILVEERLALAVKRPEAFVKGTFLP